MTLKNALDILDGYTRTKTEVKIGLEDPTKSWNEKDDLSKQVAKMIAESLETDIIVLEEIKRQIKPNCPHPKKLRDTLPDGTTYCMGCNLDL